MTTEWNGTSPNAHDPLTGVHHGDCRHYLSVLDAGSAPLIFADPPFNVNYEYDVYQDNRSVQEYLDWTREWGRDVVRVLASDGTFWLAIGDEFAAELKMIFHRELGLSLRSWVVWYFTFGVNSPKKFTRSHTHLFYFVKDPKRFYFDADAIKVPSARQLIYNDKRAKDGGRLPDDTWILRKWLTFDLSAEYAAKARERVDAAKIGEPLSGEAIYRPGKSASSKASAVADRGLFGEDT
jgi:hypothetical protein